LDSYADSYEVEPKRAVASPQRYTGVFTAATGQCAVDEDFVLVKRWRLEELMREAGVRDLKSRHILFSSWRSAARERAEDRLGGRPLGARYITQEAPCP
jgi:hypothetical protein